MEKINIDDITITTLEVDDIKEIELIEKELNINLFSENKFREELSLKHVFYYVAKYDEKIIGYINFSYIFENMELLNIVVSKKYQKMSIASLLLNFIENICITNGVTNIILEVRKSNISAKNLYEKFNYNIIDTRKDYYMNPIEDAYIMLKKLH